MYMKSVCRLCLAMDAPMHNITDSPMQDIYEKLTNISLNIEHRPVVACHICYYQLRKCYELMVRSVRADKVLTRILQSGELETEKSMAMLIHEAHQHRFNISPIKIITVTGSDHNSIKTEIIKEPMSPQHIEKSETDGPVYAKHLKLEESEDNKDMKGNFVADVDIESQTMIDGRHKEQDPLYVCIPIEYIKTEQMTDGGNVKSEGTENINRRKYEGATTSKECEQMSAENTGHIIKPAPGGINIPEKPTRLESTTVNDYTRSDSSSKHLVNMYNDCGNMFAENHLVKQIKRHDMVKRCTGLASDESCSYECVSLQEPSFSRTGVGVEHTETHSGKNTFRCEICQRIFSQKANLNVHLRTHTGEKPFECEICKSRFSDKSNLNKHLQKHTKGKPFECLICKSVFTEKGSLKIHLRTHTGVKPFECEVCKMRYSQKGYLTMHMRTHTGVKPFECEICGTRFSMKNVLRIHLRKHTGEKPYECEICKDRFSQKKSLKIHLRKHTGERPFECEICKVRFSDKSNLNRHLQNHTGDRPFECEICKVTFNRKHSLNKHLRKHSGEKPFKCEVCNIRFSEKFSLNVHSRKHTGEKPYECEICKDRFSQKVHLTTHLQTHTGVKPFECEICKLRFSQKVNLNIHLRKHTGEKPFECEICKLRFSQKVSLNRHMRTHTGEKPFECEICKVRFRDKSNLKRHMQKHTGEQPL